MIVARVLFPVKVADKEEFVKKMAATTPKYEGMEGLTRKYYVMTEDNQHAGGIYLWENQAAADAAYSEEWKAYMTEKYDHPPHIEFYEMPITMDREYDCVYDEGDVADAAE